MDKSCHSSFVMRLSSARRIVYPNRYDIKCDKTAMGKGDNVSKSKPT